MDFSSILSMLGGMNPSFGSLPAGSISSTPTAPSLPSGAKFGGAPSAVGQIGQALSDASGGGNQRFLSGLSAAQLAQLGGAGMGHLLKLLMPDLFSDLGQQ